MFFRTRGRVEAVEHWHNVAASLAFGSFPGGCARGRSETAVSPTTPTKNSSSVQRMEAPRKPDAAVSRQAKTGVPKSHALDDTAAAPRTKRETELSTVYTFCESNSMVSAQSCAAGGCQQWF